jgi:hypothetical protein
MEHRSYTRIQPIVSPPTLICPLNYTESISNIKHSPTLLHHYTDKCHVTTPSQYSTSNQSFQSKLKSNPSRRTNQRRKKRILKKISETYLNNYQNRIHHKHKRIRDRYGFISNPNTTQQNNFKKTIQNITNSQIINLQTHPQLKHTDTQSHNYNQNTWLYTIYALRNNHPLAQKTY